MKKLFAACSLVFALVAGSSSQTTAPKQTTKPAAAALKPAAAKSSVKSTTAQNSALKTAHLAATKPATDNAVQMKKDGTPDKRFKVNKEAKKHVKKDGTADMRFKENKKP
jgi:hypothetical protein